MKKFLRILLVLLGVLILIIAVTALFINFSGPATYKLDELQTIELTIDHSPENVQNGLRIVSIMCAECHRGTDGKISGKLHYPSGSAFGEVHASNITRSKEYGIGEWTDAELAYFLRTGIRNDGRFTIQPWMPKFPHLSESDMNDVIAFLRSEHPLVQASDVNHPEPKPNFLHKMLSRMAFKPLPYPETAIAAPDTSDPIALGRYIVNDQMLCYACHSAAFETNNEIQPDLSMGYMGGGAKMHDQDYKDIFGPNITMDKETGIGNWTYEDFSNSLRWGTRPDGSLIRYPMPKFSPLSEKEIQAVWAYLQQVPVINNDISAKKVEVE